MLTNKKHSFQNSCTIETGLSDFHKMTLTVLKSHFKKKDPITITYRDFKKFDALKFREDVEKGILNVGTLDIDDFNSMFTSIWNCYAPIKKKVVRGNNAPFMNKTLSKAFMKRSQLKNNFHKNPSEQNKRIFKKYRNFCVSLLKKEKRKYYSNLDLKILENNKLFWKNIKPFFSGKSKLSSNITLIDGEKVLTDKNDVAEALNEHFTEAVQNLGIEKFGSKSDLSCENADEIIDDILERYKNHPSILKIKENVVVGEKFTFSATTQDDMYCKIKALDPKKACIKNDIPVKALIGTNDIISNHLKNVYNSALEKEKFPTSLKKADITPIYKDKERTSKKNYRPLSILPVISKPFESTMGEQILSYIEKCLSAFNFAYRKRIWTSILCTHND